MFKILSICLLTQSIVLDGSTSKKFKGLLSGERAVHGIGSPLSIHLLNILLCLREEASPKLSEFIFATHCISSYEFIAC